jgi:hypothetical protein
LIYLFIVAVTNENLIGPTTIQICHACFKVAKKSKNFVKKDLNQFPKILQDVKVDEETVLRAIHLSDLQKLPQHSSLEICDEEKVCRRKRKTNTKAYILACSITGVFMLQAPTISAIGIYS